jgi:hypothetical protein
MRLDVDSEAADVGLHPKVLELAKAIGVVFLHHGNRSARGGGVDPFEARIELDDIRARWNGDGVTVRCRSRSYRVKT